MNGEPKTRTVLLTIAGALLLTSLTTALDPPQTPRVEHESRWWPQGQGSTLGTIGYRPSQQEQSVFNRLPPGEVVTGSLAEDYDISTKDNVSVGWFGIVRRIDEDKTALRTVLTVEHKYFDGLTDVHQQTVSFNGAGDFLATLTGTNHRIPPLSLVKVYGRSVRARLASSHELTRRSFAAGTGVRSPSLARMARSVEMRRGVKRIKFPWTKSTRLGRTLATTTTNSDLASGRMVRKSASDCWTPRAHFQRTLARPWSDWQTSWRWATHGARPKPNDSRKSID
jgi:hypothetical protein